MSSTLHNRVQKLECDVDLLTAALKANSPAVKTTVEKLWDIAQPFRVVIIPSVTLFLVGYSFQESVKQDLEERKAGIESVKEIRELIRELLSDNIDPEKALSASLAIAAFGRYSVAPLAIILESGGVNRMLGAQRGLVAAGLVDKKYTCKILVDILDNRTQRYTSIVHRQIIRTIADIGCVGEDGSHGDSALQRYRVLLKAGQPGLANALADGSDDSNVLFKLHSELSLAEKRLGLNGGHPNVRTGQK